MQTVKGIRDEILAFWGTDTCREQVTKDGIATFWIVKEKIRDVLSYIKNTANPPYRMLLDLSAIDERTRKNRMDQPESDFTVFYLLYSFDRNEYLRVKCGLKETDSKIPSITDLWRNANWYEREAWDMFGIEFEGHPCLRRILMPPWWKGHPLRKEHPARGTEMGRFQLPDEAWQQEEEQLKFEPKKWGLPKLEGAKYTFLNFGPHHPGTHGVLRLVLVLDGENIVDVVPDIGFHHRAAEKTAERQTWHTYIPYTDRVDYLAGTLNNLAYLMPIEKLAGIEVPDRAKVIRIMLSELYRISNHLVWYGTFVQDLGALSPVFYMFTDREKLLGIIEAVCGARLHPNWFRMGGVAQDLPAGWDKLVRDFLDYMPARLDEYDKMIMQNSIFKARTKGISPLAVNDAIEWGITGPNLRACGLAWDFRKKMPYSGYDQFEFEVPVGSNGDCYERAIVHVEEMRQSLRIIRQCMDSMPPGPFKAEHPLTTPLPKERTLHDIETLIDHFLNVTWGPVLPAGESFFGIEGPRGNYGYYAISDGSTGPYRLRIRGCSFAHIQAVPFLSRGLNVSDLIAILGSIDFILSDVDR